MDRVMTKISETNNKLSKNNKKEKVFSFTNILSSCLMCTHTMYDIIRREYDLYI